MMANDYYIEYKQLKNSIELLKNKLNDRLKFLLFKFKSDKVSFRYGAGLVLHLDKLTDETIISTIYDLTIENKISLLDSIEKWISDNKKIVQLSLFE